jgi:hypothetical protein
MLLGCQRVIVVLLVKSIVLTFAIASVTLLTQLFPMLNSPSLGNSFSFCQISQANLIQSAAPDRIDILSENGEYISGELSKKKASINQVKKHVKIKFRQSGGYTGLQMGCDLDNKSLSPAEFSQLESLVKTSGIVGSNSSRSENTADLINYEITIETKEGIHQVQFDDLTLPDSILPLLDYLQSKAKPLR